MKQLKMSLSMMSALKLSIAILDNMKNEMNNCGTAVDGILLDIEFHLHNLIIRNVASHIDSMIA